MQKAQKLISRLQYRGDKEQRCPLCKHFVGYSFTAIANACRIIVIIVWICISRHEDRKPILQTPDENKTQINGQDIYYQMSTSLIRRMLKAIYKAYNYWSKWGKINILPLI